MKQKTTKPAGAACADCPLRDAPCVPTERPHGAPKLAIVGEGPGRFEVEKGRPFIGPTGAVVMRYLRRMGLRREDVLFTNAVLCAGKESQLGRAKKACNERLRNELEGTPYVVTFGSHGLHAVLAKRKARPKILEWRGSVVQERGRVILPTVHPAFVMRSPVWRQVIDWDFSRIGRILRDGFTAPEKQPGRRFVLVRTYAALATQLAALEDTVEFDVETVGLGPTRTDLVCFVVADTKTSVVVPWSASRDGRTPFWGQPGRVARLVTQAFEHRSVVTHNGPGFDHIIADRYGIRINKWEDTLLAHHVVAGHMPKNLGHVVSMYLDAPPWKHKEEKSIRDLYYYNGQDGLYGVLVWHNIQKELAPLRHVYEQDKLVADLCRKMTVTGIRYDARRAHFLRGRLETAERRCERRANRLAGRTINLRSQLQLRKLLFDEMGAPYFYISDKTGQPSLNEATLRAYLAYQHPGVSGIAQCVLDMRAARGTRSRYIDQIIVEGDGRVHPGWLSYGAVSGRFACRNPNLMNLVKAAKDPSIKWGGIKSLYIPARGHTFVAFDFSQLEMRIAAYFSGDETMIGACETSDLHAANAALIWGVAFTSATKEEQKELRDIAKQSGFAIAYMAGASTVYMRILATGKAITLQQVEKMLRTLRLRFSRYYEFQEEKLLETVRTGHIQIPISGRIRYVGHAPEAAEVANTPIQGGAAGLMNLKLPQIADLLPRGVRLVAQIHDAAIFETPLRHVPDALAIIKETAELPVEIGGRMATFPVELQQGDKWSELKKVG